MWSEVFEGGRPFGVRGELILLLAKTFHGAFSLRTRLGDNGQRRIRRHYRSDGVDLMRNLEFLRMPMKSQRSWSFISYKRNFLKVVNYIFSM